MNIINEEITRSREVVAGYKQLNKNTIETVKTYDPRLKIWTFKKIIIDPNASDFKKIYVKPERKKTAKIPKKNKPKENLISSDKKSRPTGLKYTPRKKITNHLEFDQNTLISKAYNYYLDGKNNDEISKLMNMKKRAVISMLRKRDGQLGIKIPKNYTYDKVINFIKEGKKLSEISNILNICEHTVSYHVKNYNDSKTEIQIEAEYKEILSAIKNKSKLNQVDYCYSTWISQNNCRMKSNLTTPARNKRCRELVKQGRLIEVVEKKSLRHGAMYKIPKK